MRIMNVWLLPLLMVAAFRLSSGQTLEGRTLKVVTIVNNPFVMKDPSSPKGYVGYYIDMLNLLERELKFNSQIYEVADGRYGMQEGGRWNGMIGDVVDKRADMTLATLRITTNRMKAVDFTVPVSASGMSILIKKPGILPTASTAALVAKPFAPSTWILLLLLYIIYTAIAFAIWLLSPYELNQRPLTANSAVARARKAGCGAWLFVTGGLFLQGFARTPKAPSARILAFFWWLFVLATVSCYVANLVPILTLLRADEELKPLITNMQDLVQQSDVNYGVIRDGATKKMLEESTLPEYKSAYAYLTRNPSNYANTTAQAIEKVRAGNYAWIAEGVTAEYYAMNMCDLSDVPTGLSSLDFGVAVAKGSDLKASLDDAILKIKISGELGSLRSRWWAPAAGGRCEDAAGARKGRDAVDSLLPGDLVVLYVLLLIGGLAALVALPLELKVKAALPWTADAPSAPAKSADADTNLATGAAAAAAAVDSKESKEEPTPESRPLV